MKELTTILVVNENGCQMESRMAIDADVVKKLEDNKEKVKNFLKDFSVNHMIEIPKEGRIPVSVMAKTVNTGENPHNSEAMLEDTHQAFLDWAKKLPNKEDGKYHKSHGENEEEVETAMIVIPVYIIKCDGKQNENK